NMQTLEIILACAAGLLILFVGYRVGRLVGSLSASKDIARKEEELFTAQKGFKSLYEQELATVRAQNEQLKQQAEALNARVEEYVSDILADEKRLPVGPGHGNGNNPPLLTSEVQHQQPHSQERGSS